MVFAEKTEEYQRYLVIFLDILGQKELLSQMTELPKTEDEKNKFKTLSDKTHGKIVGIRNCFFKCFEAILNTLPPINRPKIYYYGISDSIIIAVPLDSNQNDTAIIGCFSALAATCIAGLFELAKKTVIRGGLDISTAIRIGENEIYGHAVASAHYIESQLADYPRFVVGDELRKYIRETESQEPSSSTNDNIKIANMCRELFFQDSDGCYMLDYLGSAMGQYMAMIRDSGNVDSNFSKIHKNAFNFVKAEYDGFVNEANENSQKLALRYHRLLSYFELRRSLWE